ncbi:MAG: FAD-binding oxidoreductase [Pirellulaceae bacterium]|nr:FAD-binding oxidoreductase [Pirellulaceae bacterium]
MKTRRQFLRSTVGAAAALAVTARLHGADEQPGMELNDVQSQLNATRVHQVVRPTTMDQVAEVLAAAAKDNRAVSVAGGRHAMGGQQFGSDTLHLDLTGMSRVLKLDREKGRIEVEAGIQWPELLTYLHKEQAGQASAWSIRQKQTGVDRVTMAGTLSANAHARGLKFKPIIDDVESFVLVDAAGKTQACSRTSNPELFRLAIGGYGLFGVITQVRLRLVKRQKMERVVKVIPLRDLIDNVQQRIADGFVYGDCQYSTDIDAESPEHPGVFSCYRPVANDVPIPENRKLSEEDWTKLYVLARTDKKKAFAAYAGHYLKTNGQIYWSDLHQVAGLLDVRNLQEALVRYAGQTEKGSEMITEVYVRRDNLAPFLRAARKDILDHQIDLTYGTIRFIEKDEESFLAWAKEQSVCVLCNLHVVHTAAGKEKAAADLRRLIGRAIEFGGRYFLTYHRWATHDQVQAANPQFVEFLKLKKKYDPSERFQSEWYRHYRKLFGDQL